MISAAASHRYLALGDSYTIGEGVAADERWPSQLVRGLQHDGISIGDAQIVARTGWTTSELSKAMDDAELSANRALVTLQIGVNNQYRNESMDTYRVQFSALLARAVELANGHAARVVVVSIPDWGGTCFAREEGRDCARIALELDDYNAIAHEETSRVGARWVDITSISRRRQPDWVAADGLHPAAAQYAAWVERILPAARTALS